jgi:signal transduction histidine kinase
MNSSTPINSPARDTADLAALLAESGDENAARRARAVADRVSVWEVELRQSVSDALAMHHEMNNALTGVFGNAQLLLMGPAGQDPGVRKRLESLLHEAERIRDVAARLRDLRRQLSQSSTAPQAGGSGAARGDS